MPTPTTSVCAGSTRRARSPRAGRPPPPASSTSSTALAGEGLLVVANRGDCPLGRLQERLGDPVPLFELVLSPRAARRAVPVLGAVTVTGVAMLLRGSRGRQ